MCLLTYVKSAEKQKSEVCKNNLSGTVFMVLARVFLKVRESVGLVPTLRETLILLIVPADSLGTGVPTDLQFEDEGATRLGKTRPTTPQEVGQTVRMLCSLTSDPQLVGQ